MAQGVLFSLLMVAATSIAGCIVPVPLEQQPSSTDHPPAIVKGDAEPPFGQVAGHAGTAFEFRVSVDDPDLDDQLFARLLRLTPSGDKITMYDAGGALPSAGDAAHPERRVATFPTVDYCQAFGISQPTTIYIRVSDLAFKTPGNGDTEGLFDESLWVLTCN